MCRSSVGDFVGDGFDLVDVGVDVVEVLAERFGGEVEAGSAEFVVVDVYDADGMSGEAVLDDAAASPPPFDFVESRVGACGGEGVAVGGDVEGHTRKPSRRLSSDSASVSHRRSTLVFSGPVCPPAFGECLGIGKRTGAVPPDFRPLTVLCSLAPCRANPSRNPKWIFPL